MRKAYRFIWKMLNTARTVCPRWTLAWKATFAAKHVSLLMKHPTMTSKSVANDAENPMASLNFS